MNALVKHEDAAEDNGDGAPPPQPLAEAQQSDRPNVEENPDDRVSGEKNEEVKNEPNDDAATSLEEGDKEDMEVDAINSEVNEQLDDELNSYEFDINCNSSELLTQERRSSKKRQRVSASNSPGTIYHARRASESEIKSDVAETMVHLPDDAGGNNVTTTIDDNKGEILALESSEPNYRWIGEGIQNGTSIDYQGVEIDFTNMKTPSPDAHNSPFVVRIGEVVLISSDDTPWYESTSKNLEFASSSEEHVSIYDDPASRESLGALDPFIGVIDRLWEETDDCVKAGPGPGRKKKGKNGKSCKSSSSSPLSMRRMMRTRWFFKKEDMEGIRGNLVVEGVGSGGTTDDILTNLSPQDLVLTDQYDDNVITTIMGKARVVKKNPTYQSIQENESFICSYYLNFINDSRKVIIFPFTDDGADNFTVSPHHVSNSTSSDPTITDDERNGNKPSASQSHAQLSMSSTRRVASVGETLFVGKIRISENHQADIPPQLDLQRKVSFRGLANPPSQRIPTLVWDPANDEGDQVDTFIMDAYSLLGEYLRTIGVEPFHDVNYIGSFDNKAEAKRPREIDMCSLLAELHECRGDARKAIRRIEADPELYLTYFNKKDMDRFDASYRIYRDSIRMIANAFGDDKCCKEVVDYQYRFKYCENFRRFMRKKREKAEEMMATVEDRMLLEKINEEDKNSPGGNDDNDSTSSDDDGKVPASTNVTLGGTSSMLTAVPATRLGPVNNRIRTWFRTGGGDKDAVGATQQRRNNACGFLKQLREKVGEEAYDTLAKSIKTCCSSNPAADSLLLDVKSTAKDLMKSYPELLEQFLTFLPKEIRCN